MKKTLIALLALAGVSQSATVITVAGTGGGTTLPSFPTDAFLWNDTLLADKDDLIHTTQSNDIISASWADGGKIWGNQATTGSWTNQLALDEMNSTLGTSITLDNINSLNFAAPGWPKTLTATITLHSIEAGTKIAFYTLATATNDPLANLTITGIDNARYSYAVDTANGFGETPGFSDTGKAWTLVKVEGTLADGASGASPTITVSSTTSKNGFGMFAYGVVPEPTTATLSLLALAGLAARRRRR